MKRIISVIVGLALVVAGWWYLGRHSVSLVPRPPSRVREPNVESSKHSHGGDTDADQTRRELAELRAQVQERDKLIRTLLSQGARGQASAQPPNNEQTEANDRIDVDESAGKTPTDLLISRLDERLFGGVMSARETREIRDAAELATRTLPSTVKSKIDCSTDLCRVTVQGAEGDLDRDCGKLIESMPKRFAGALVLPEGDGQRAVFATTRRELLSMSD